MLRMSCFSEKGQTEKRVAAPAETLQVIVLKAAVIKLLHLVTLALCLFFTQTKKTCNNMY